MKTRILLMDDDSRYLDLLRMMLESDGYDVATGTNGSELPELVSRHAPHVIVLDVLMGSLNGVSLAHELRQTSSSADTPIIFVSAWTGARDIKLPKNSYRVFKPFTHSEITSAIEQALGKTATSVN
ncbi:MAG: response regulator [Calditrichaeota bacterium]|nr:response regulator [Calditrichota bacterium]MCB9368524.1 response regulator [Calditrichota bacterium]